MPEATKIRLCLVLHAPLGGGAEKVMLELAAHLDRAIFDIHFVLLNARGEHAHLLPKDIPVIDLGIDLPGPYQLTGLDSLWKLSRVLKKIDPQLIFSTLGYTNLMTIMARWLSGVKARLIVRETTVLSVYLQTDKFSSLKSCLYRFFYPRADVIVGPSRAVIEDLDRLVPAPKGQSRRVIANFIDPEDIETGLSEKRDVLWPGLKIDRPVIISVGHLERIKGIDQGLRAFAEVARSRPLYYWILGAGSQEQELQQLSSHLGVEKSVYFLGFQRNPYVFLKHAAIFFLPSRFEGFPNALLEAMYVGLPSVVTHYNSSVTDFIREVAEGLIVDPNDTSGMANALEKLIDDHALRERMGNKAREAAKKFDVHHFVARYEQLFREVAGK